MKIFDCFPFFNELEILELRLATLSSVVDYFVLVEASKTHTGKPKEFFFEKNRWKYRKYLDRIIHIKVEDVPKLSGKPDDWTIENFQRNCIDRGLTNAKVGDKIIISDADEIPDPAQIAKFKEGKEAVIFKPHMFNYFVNCLDPGTWNGPIMVSFDEKTPSPQKLRVMGQHEVNIIEVGGWHYSYIGGVDRIRKKLDSIVDGAEVADRVGSDEDITRKVNSLKCLWDENTQFFLVDISKNNLAPKTMKQFLAKYPEFYFRQSDCKHGMVY